MIGVLCKESEARTVEEFFELFKTPWEYYAPHRGYDVVIVTSEDIPQDPTIRALVIYNSNSIDFDLHLGVTAQLSEGTCEWLEWHGTEFPVYGKVAVLQSAGRQLLRRRQTLDTVCGIIGGAERPTVRIGLDLFREASFLLCQGQPAENALITTLDIHISLLREIMLDLGVPFVEVPPAPAGYDFAACLTHDVDFVGIRDHKFDHTMWGFLYRCLIVSPLQALRGRLPWAKCLRNWAAALSLPLVYLGLRDDFWLEFARYVEIEKDLGSTFFFIPFKNAAGTKGSSPASARRAAKYDVSQIKDHVLRLLRSGCEVGLHGIDAWQDPRKARSELGRMQEVAGQSVMGTRMHWLYWAEGSPRILEEAGLAYDSTFGYNEAIGFRAGTTQPFCPLGAERLLELPLNIQDSSMFYTDRMKLSEAEALNACKGLIRSAVSSGGALTVNWHTRSLSPERLWGDFYARLLQEIQKHRVWFGTAQELVGWFRNRRALRFHAVQFEENCVSVALRSSLRHFEPPVTLRTYHPRFVSDRSGLPVSMPAYTDTQWNGEKVLKIACDDPAGTFDGNARSFQ